MRLLRRVLFCGCVILFAAACAAAEFTPRISTLVSDKSPSAPAVVQINGREVFRLLSTSAGLTPGQRATIAASRLQKLVDSGANPKLLKVQIVASDRADVMWGDQRLFKVTEAEAKAHGSTTVVLARKWVASIRWMLTQPPVTVSPQKITVPLGETRPVTIGGTALGEVSVADTRPTIATTTIAPDGRCLIVEGISTGDSSVIVSRAGASVSLDVAVRKYAGRVTRPNPVWVTGHPASSDMLLQLAEAEVSRSMILEPGARGILTAPTQKPPDLPGGAEVDVRFSVMIQGDGYIPITVPAVVNVVNEQLPNKPTASLMYSNSPERVTKFATLFFGQLGLDEPTRLLYHHQNMMHKPFLFSVLLINTGITTARAQIIRGIPEPEVDTIAVGYKAGLRFLPRYIRDVGEIVELPPLTKMAVTRGIIERLNTASGVMQFRQLEGDPLCVRLAADTPDNRSIPGNLPMAAGTPDINYALSPWVYPTPTKSIIAKYVVGKNWSFIPIGRHPIKDADQKQDLFGNYGVLYDISLELENPTAARKNVDIMFEAGAGTVCGVFLIDGQYLKAGYVVPPREVRLTRYSLGPGQKKTVSIKTSPLAGSSYPATILARS